MPPKQSAVESLRPSRTPHPSRTSSIKHWHLDQIDADDPAVALLNISITAGGQVNTKGLGLDHLHAAIILDELDRLREQIAAYVHQVTPSNVIRLHR